MAESLPLSESAAPEAMDGYASAGPSDILSQIRGGIAGMSDNHRRIAQCLLDDPHWLMKANVADIAARTAVSAPTIVRFARKIGCAGLTDLKLKLAGALALGAPFLHRAVKMGDPAADVLRNVTGSVTTVLADWQRRIDPQEIERAANAIHSAGQIQCFGTGALSHFLAQDLHARLFRLGLDVQTFSDAHYQLVAAAALKPGDVLIAVSFVGRMPALLRAVAVAKARGARIIALTRADTPLAKLADIVLQMDVPTDSTMLVGTDAYVVQLITIEVLMILVGLKQGPQLMERMQDIQKMLHSNSIDNEDPAVLHTSWRRMLSTDAD